MSLPPESRVLVLPAILRHLRYHISNRDDLLEKCLTVLGAILKHLHDQDPVSRGGGKGGILTQVITYVVCTTMYSHILKLFKKNKLYIL